MEHSDVDRSLLVLALALGGVSALIVALAWLERTMHSHQHRSHVDSNDR